MSEDRSDVPKYVSWAKAVKVRDSYTCQICGATNVYLESHHINSWDWDVNSRYLLDNGVSLCSNNGCFAHQHFHKIFGYGGNHEYQFEQFKKIFKIFKSLISSRTQTDPILSATEK
jgi:hypothetical protein